LFSAPFSEKTYHTNRFDRDEDPCFAALLFALIGCMTDTHSSPLDSALVSEIANQMALPGISFYRKNNSLQAFSSPISWIDPLLNISSIKGNKFLLKR